MNTYRVIEVKQSVFADNNRDADALRQELREQGTCLINLMSSPPRKLWTTKSSTTKKSPICSVLCA